MPAVDQLESIFDFIAEENPAAAERTIRRIRQAILRTARMPNSGRIGRVAGTREITVSGTRYVVAYRVLEKMIQVLAVFHGAQKWPKSF
jgi:addiction module RelE/StbE family toxin